MSTDTTSERRRRPRALLPIAGIAAIVIAATVAIAASSHSKPKLPNGARTTPSASFAGAELSPIRQAPPIDLRDALGHRVTLAQDRGKVTLVTFLYTHCPDVCPLIASNLALTEHKLGAKARDVALVAVSVDPRRDTPAAVKQFVRQHQLTGRMEYLIGNADQLARTWKAWNVGSKADASNPQFVAHSALVYGVSAKGRLTTIYPANFKPADIVHDVPLLAAR